MELNVDTKTLTSILVAREASYLLGKTQYISTRLDSIPGLTRIWPDFGILTGPS